MIVEFNVSQMNFCVLFVFLWLFALLEPTCAFAFLGPNDIHSRRGPPATRFVRQQQHERWTPSSFSSFSLHSKQLDSIASGAKNRGAKKACRWLHPCARANSNDSILRFAKQSQDEEPLDRARVRFSGPMTLKQMDPTGVTSSSSLSTLQDPVDIILSLFTSDVGSIAVGVLGILALLIGRTFFFFDDSEETAVITTTSVTRSNLLAICAAGAILLNGVSKLNVESALATPVDLTGVVSVDPAILLKYWDLLIKNNMTEGPSTSRLIKWTMKSFLVATSAQTVVLLGRNKDAWCFLALAGRLPRALFTNETNDQIPKNDNGEVINLINTDDLPSHTPILDRFLIERRRETYLPMLQALPGKIEFTYLASNTQAALLVPVQRQDDNDNDYDDKFRPMVLVLGSNQARSFTPRDIAWCQAVGARLGDELSKLSR